MKDHKKTPLWDNSLPVEERLDYLISQMTLEEKIQCMSTSCPEIPRLGIKESFVGGEAAHGIEARHDQAFNAGKPELTTSFTQPIGMSSSFDRELIAECGRAVGEEARALFNRSGRSSLCRWAPTIDMERDPRWGRTEEAYGEDPYLTGEMAAAYIRGMRGKDSFYIQCGATLKHFYANNVEQDRIKISSSLDNRNKYEYYLEPFRKAVEEGKAEAVMTSYNEINGVPAIVNHEVRDLVKKEWGLPGHVVCDGGDFQQTVLDHQYFGTHAETLAYGLKAGVDCFTDNKEVVFAAAREALEKGLITEADLDGSIRNSFRTRIRLGFFDEAGDCPYAGMGEEYVNNEEHQKICRQMADESVVLLKNDNEFLPIRPEGTESLAVIGPLADVWYKDWYGGIPPYQVTPLDGIKNAYPNAKICHHSGLSVIRLTCNGRYVGLDETGRLQLTDPEGAESFLLNDWGCESITLMTQSNGKYVVLEEGSYLIKADKEEVFAWFIRESWKFKGIDGNRSEDMKGLYHLDSWNGRRVTTDSDGYLAVVKTDETVPGEGDDEKLGRKSYALSEGNPALFEMEIVEDGIKKAAEAAAKAEKAVLVLGCNPVINSKEEIDRTTLQLPPFQQKLADAVFAANREMVVVFVSNYPYLIHKLSKTVPAVLLTASGSQELGNGIGDVLCGNISPAGRLPMTWYLRDEDLPDINDYDIIQGKRTYQYFDREVLYPFGYGLSYTEFEYGTIQWRQLQDKERSEDVILLQLSVTNIGTVCSDEVVQLYVHKMGGRVTNPICQLKGFERIKSLAPGETKKVEFRVKLKDLRYYDVISETMILEEGDYVFMAGASSRNIRQEAVVPLCGEKAGSRDPFAVTKAILFDSSRNCFIHRGTKEHAMAGETCIIPGKAGDPPDSAGKMSERPCCRLQYRDFIFDRAARRVVLKVCGVEEGIIMLRCMSGDFSGQSCRVKIPQSPMLEFIEIVAELPEDFVKTQENVGLQIDIEGKIKLSGFSFIS